ncbi:MAG: hypothetical protein ACU84Q_20830 [Gammaproteobacteria bacterium]
MPVPHRFGFPLPILPRASGSLRRVSPSGWRQDKYEYVATIFNMVHTNKFSTCFSALQIDVARHATDDFNPFHDKQRWKKIRGNPFSGPLALGFQSIAFMDNALRGFRAAAKETDLLDQHNLRFSNTEVKFINAITADQTIELEIRKSNWFAEKNELRNRVVLRADDRIVLTGHKTESKSPLLDIVIPSDVTTLRATEDRTFIANTDWFLKRKYTMTSNAKNFLAASGVEPATYIDEIIDRVDFPESYPLSLISCALLERGIKTAHDFMAEPMVYAYHRFTTDRLVLAELKSNVPLDIVVGAPQELTSGNKLTEGIVKHTCVAYSDSEMLYLAEIGLMPLTRLAAVI